MLWRSFTACSSRNRRALKGNSYAKRRKRNSSQVYRSGFSRRAVPKLLHTPEQLEYERLGPEEGFLLSRINGESDIQSILSVCPFREADSLRMIKKLLDGGIIGINYIEVSAGRNSHP